jgi:hypothetical protein
MACSASTDADAQLDQCIKTLAMAWLDLQCAPGKPQALSSSRRTTLHVCTSINLGGPVATAEGLLNMLTPHTAVEVSEGADRHRSGARRLASVRWRTEYVLSGTGATAVVFSETRCEADFSQKLRHQPLARHGTS